MGEPPEEYTNAKQNLLNFRDKIIGDLLSGRITALLDAGHDCMQKYKSVVEGISVTAYLFKALRRRALALKFKNMDIGEGGIGNIKLSYTGETAEYPLGVCPEFTDTKPLPKVDLFEFTPRSMLEILEKSGDVHVRGGFWIQADNNMFENTPEMENAAYDYYMIYAHARYRGEWNLISPAGITYDRIEGEMLHCVTKLRSTADGVWYTYVLQVWFDVAGKDGSGNRYPEIGFLYGFKEEGAPDVTYVAAGQRFKVGSPNLILVKAPSPPAYYGGWSGSPLINVAESITEAYNPDTVWVNYFTVKVTVEPEDGGTTVPPPGEYMYRAGYLASFQANPNPGYVFDHWEVDGVYWSSDNPTTIPPWKDMEVKAVFTSA